MYTLKEETFNNLKTEMKTVLKNYGQKKDDALDNILKSWLKAKSPLLDILSKHPNWNEDKLMIQFDAEYSRKFDTGAIVDFRAFIVDYLMKKYHVRYFSNLPRKECDILWFIYNIKKPFFDKDMDCSINELNRLNDNFKIRNNMKASKAIGKICSVMEWDKIPDYDKEYAKLCDALSPNKATRHTCISLNPIDYLLMSNGNSWESCHKIRYNGRSGGCYTSGTISYMLDTSSFVFYTVDVAFNGEDIELEPKIQRQIFGYKPNVILQSRLYPQRNDNGASELYKDIRDVVHQVVSDCLGVPNNWVEQNNNQMSYYVRKTSKATAYPDYRYDKYLCNISVHKAALDREEKLKMIMMGRQPICIKCGNKHSRHSNLYCSKCDW